MESSPISLKRGMPVQHQIQTSCAELTTAIEKYSRHVFHELLRIQHSRQDGSEIRKRYISSYTFWQYSKMPRLISDRLFDSLSDEQGWSCTDLIAWISLELRGSILDQLKISFKMLDWNKDGFVSKDECVTLLNHIIANPIIHSYPKSILEKGRLIKLIDQFYEAVSSQKVNIEQYEEWYSEGKWELHDTIWNCVTESLNSRNKVQNFAKLTMNPTSEIKNKEEREEKKNALPQILHEGKMYSMTDAGLHLSIYKIINNALYQFKKHEDVAFQTYTYIGHGTCVVPFTPQLQTTSHKKLYGLYVVSGFKRLKFYLLGEDNYLHWKKALEQATGSKAEIQKDYTFKEELGKGKHGYVKSAVCNKTRKTVAIKVIKKTDMDVHTRQLVKEEINVQRMCKHPNLVQILDVYEDLEHVYLVLELMEGKTLMEYLYEKKEQKSKIDNQEMKCIILQLARALEYLKSFNIVHRDVKAENVLLTGKFLDYKVKGKQVQAPEVKLSDFFLSTIITHPVGSKFNGTITHIAPEILEGMQYSFGVDMFSFGVLIYQCMTGSLPFFHPELDKLKAQIKYEQPKNMEELQLTLPSFLFQLISSLLKKRGSQRLEIERLVLAPQLSEIYEV